MLENMMRKSPGVNNAAFNMEDIMRNVGKASRKVTGKSAGKEAAGKPASKESAKKPAREEAAEKPASAEAAEKPVASSPEADADALGDDSPGDHSEL